MSAVGQQTAAGRYSAQLVIERFSRRSVFRSLPRAGYAPPVNIVWILNGPGLNLLGQREPEIYGADTLDSIIDSVRREAAEAGVEIVARQTNHEGVLLDWMCEADAASARALILNAGGLSHTSVALHDMIRGVRLPVIAVHLSNTASRESFRQRDLVAAAARGSIGGFGPLSYSLALRAALSL